MDPDVILRRIGQVVSKRGAERLIIKKFLLGRQWNCSKRFRFREALTIEAVPLDQDGPHLLEAGRGVRHGGILQPFAKHMTHL